MSQSAENSDQDDFQDISKANFQKVQSKISKVGYADGVAAGREIAFQSGFDTGYADGILTGFELHKYKMFFEHLPKSSLAADEDLQRESRVYRDMQIPDVKSPEHFQYTKHNQEDMKITQISEKQQQYTRDLLDKCKQSFPLATKLLKSEYKLEL